MKLPFYRLIALMALSITLQLAAPQAAYSCAVTSLFEFPKENVESSDIIFRGKVVAYELVHPYIAKLKFETTNTYKGLEKPSWYVLWYIYLPAVPKNLQEFTAKYGEDVVVGIWVLPISEVFTELSRVAWIDALHIVAEVFDQMKYRHRVSWTLPRVVAITCLPDFIEKFELLESRLRELGVLE